MVYYLYFLSAVYCLFVWPINRVLGFSRETLVAVITDIDGREWQRRHSSQRGGIPDHPRASTSDDVECFFSMAFGQNVTVKDHTSSHT